MLKRADGLLARMWVHWAGVEQFVERFGKLII
jgi:hypothetical protein